MKTALKKAFGNSQVIKITTVLEHNLLIASTISKSTNVKY